MYIQFYRPPVGLLYYSSCWTDTEHFILFFILFFRVSLYCVSSLFFVLPSFPFHQRSKLSLTVCVIRFSPDCFRAKLSNFLTLDFRLLFCIRNNRRKPNFVYCSELCNTTIVCSYSRCVCHLIVLLTMGLSVNA